MLTRSLPLAFLSALGLLAGCDGSGGVPATPPVVQVTTVSYEVDGMHCDGCAQAIVAELTETPGVQQAECTFESKRATVRFAAPATRESVEHAVTKLGYKVAPAAPAAPADGSAAPVAGDASR